MSKEFKKIVHNLNLAQKRVRDAVELGLGKAGLQLIDDAINEPPTVPVREGSLRASMSVAVSGKTIHTTEDQGGEGAKPSPEKTGYGSKGGRNEIIAIIGANKPCAAKTHYIEMDFVDPDAGNFWLLSKMSKYGKQYFGLVAEAVKEVLG